MIKEILNHDPHRFGIPNILSLSRLLFLPFIAHFLMLNSPYGDWMTLLLLVMSGFTDWLDGFVARRFNQQSQLGRILDPLIDKIYIGVIMLLLAAFKTLPYWYVLLVVLRDVLILIASVHIISRARVISQSNKLGKYTLFSFLATIAVYILELGSLRIIVLALSTILIPLSLRKYFIVYKQVISENRSCKDHDKRDNPACQ